MLYQIQAKNPKGDETKVILDWVSNDADQIAKALIAMFVVWLGNYDGVEPLQDYIAKFKEIVKVYQKNDKGEISEAPVELNQVTPEEMKLMEEKGKHSLH